MVVPEIGTMVQDLDIIFKPRSIAVIGSTDDSGKLGFQVTKAFVDMGVCGKIYPVNPRRRPVLGYEGYEDVKAIPGDIDLAIIVVPPAAVPEALEGCVEKGVRGAVVFSSLIGGDEKDGGPILALARERGTRIIGPDSMGLYCPSGGLALFPAMSRESGPVAFISHSGATAYIVSMYGAGRGIAFSKVVDCGNECDLTFADYLEYLGQDPETEIIAGYVEGVADGRRLLAAAREVSRKKPVILLKGGLTQGGARMVASHTGLLAGSPVTWDSLFRQSGIIRVMSLDELVDALVMFAKLKPPAGNRIALISGTGGPLVMASDLAHEYGLQVPVLSSQTRKRISEFLPRYGTSPDNPVDLSIAAGVRPELYSQSCEVLGNSDEVDILLLIHAGEWRGKEVASDIARTARGMRNSLAVVLAGNPATTSPAVKSLVDAGIPAFSSLERCVKLLSSAVSCQERQ